MSAADKIILLKRTSRAADPFASVVVLPDHGQIALMVYGSIGQTSHYLMPADAREIAAALLLAADELEQSQALALAA